MGRLCTYFLKPLSPEQQFHEDIRKVCAVRCFVPTSTKHNSQILGRMLQDITGCWQKLRSSKTSCRLVVLGSLVLSSAAVAVAAAAAQQSSCSLALNKSVKSCRPFQGSKNVQSPALQCSFHHVTAMRK